jgi:predicted GNAT family N-acyltransferase
LFRGGSWKDGLEPREGSSARRKEGAPLMASLRLIQVRTRKQISEEALIRYKVFVLEQGVPERMEIDRYEDECEHFLAVLGKKPIGCIRVREVGKDLKMERLAILKEFRGRGFGREIVGKIVAHCLRKRPREIRMHAQYRLRDFYGSFGFLPRGKPFQEAGIKHIEMFLVPGALKGSRPGEFQNLRAPQRLLFASNPRANPLTSTGRRTSPEG